ncbi:hypothetical protein HRK03_16045 [Bordetella pertussis]|nr:hypothetical protein HRK03_16045 [Bordetella pertussis]
MCLQRKARADFLELAIEAGRVGHGSLNADRAAAGDVLVDHRLPTLDLMVARERGAVDALKAFAQRRRFFLDGPNSHIAMLFKLFCSMACV